MPVLVPPHFFFMGSARQLDASTVRRRNTTLRGARFYKPFGAGHYRNDFCRWFDLGASRRAVATNTGQSLGWGSVRWASGRDTSPHPVAGVALVMLSCLRAFRGRPRPPLYNVSYSRTIAAAAGRLAFGGLFPRGEPIIGAAFLILGDATLEHSSSPPRSWLSLMPLVWQGMPLRPPLVTMRMLVVRRRRGVRLVGRAMGLAGHSC